MTDLTAFDIFFFGCLGIFALLGLVRGFVTEILGLMAWVGGIVAVNLFFDRGREAALGLTDSETGAAILSVLALFFGAFIVGKLLARAIGGRVRNSIVGPIDRVLGLGFGAVKGLLLATLVWMLATLIFDMVPGARPDWLAAARSGPLIGTVAHEVRTFVADQRAVGEEEAGYDREERSAMDALFPAGESE